MRPTQTSKAVLSNVMWILCRCQSCLHRRRLNCPSVWLYPRNQRWLEKIANPAMRGFCRDLLNEHRVLFKRSTVFFHFLWLLPPSSILQWIENCVAIGVWRLLRNVTCCYVAVVTWRCDHKLMHLFVLSRITSPAHPTMTDTFREKKKKRAKRSTDKRPQTWVLLGRKVF